MAAIAPRTKARPAQGGGPRRAAPRGTGPAPTSARPGHLAGFGPAVRLGRIQAKVEIGDTGDPYEREADRASNQVMEGSPVGEISSIPQGGLSQAPQRQADEPIQEMADEPVQEMADEPVQEMADEPVLPEEDGSIQSSAAPAPTASPPPAAHPSATGADLLMPEPTSGLSTAERERIAAARARAAAAGEATRELPAAEASVGEARGAVNEPAAETAARAQNELVEALGARPEPSPEIEELCDRIKALIKSKRPPDEEQLVKADPKAMASQAGDQLDASIEGDTTRVAGSYDAMQDPPAGEPTQVGGDMETPPARLEVPPLDATAATPDGVADEDVSLDADVEANRARIDESGLDTNVAREIDDPANPVTKSREAMRDLEDTAEQDPAAVLAEQQAILGEANAGMAALQARALETLAGSRAATVGDSMAQQGQMVGSEEQMRAQLSACAEGVFTTAQSAVDALLEPLGRTAMDKWDAGVDVLSERFEQHLSWVKSRIAERHSGGWGAVVSVWDDAAGLPGWVTDHYDAAEQTFGDGVCELIREISRDVNGVVATCEQIIEDARGEITRIFTEELPDGLEDWAAEQQAQFAGRLDGLNQRVTETRDDFNRELIQNASQAVDDVRQQVHALREAAKGLIGRIADAIKAFVDDPVKFIIDGLLKRVGIEPAAFWALVNRIQHVISDIADDPLGFANNLAAALAQGFTQFFDNIGGHLLQGLLDWLFSRLGAVGVTIPSDFSLKSIITFFLELMGITWPRVRALLAEEIGEENVALIEKVYELVANLIELGPEGLFAMLEEQLSPQAILDQVLQAAIDFLVEALIENVSERIIALFNPAGAIVQAIELVYRVLSWVFNNAARIFRLVETVINGAADLVAGNISGMATAIEGALAGLLPTVIDFLAGYFGLGDLPEKIADTIRGFQDWIEGILRRVIHGFADRGRALLSALGLGDDSDGVEEDDPEKADRVRAGLAAIDEEEQRVVEGGKISHEDAASVAARVRESHPVFTSLEVVDGGDSWDYRWQASPGDTKDTSAKKEEASGEHAANWNEVEPLLGQPMGTALPSGYAYRTQNGRQFPTRHEADDARFERLGLDTANNIKLGASEDVEQHPSRFVMEGKQNGKWLLDEGYRGSFKIRTRFYYSNRGYPTAVSDNAKAIVNAHEDPTNSANWIHSDYTGGESRPKSDFTIEHSPPVASHWTSGGNASEQPNRVGWFHFEGRANDAIPLTRGENSRRGSGGVRFTPEVALSFRGPGE